MSKSEEVADKALIAYANRYRKKHASPGSDVLFVKDEKTGRAIWITQGDATTHFEQQVKKL